MRRTYELYINGTLADIATDALVLMNYKQTDATAPAAIFNSWSQSVALPRTSKNNTIFDHIFRDDHITTSGKFNPLVRTPFVIYSQTGEILESGYLKLTEITETQYSATLYGGLGGFLFGLMYNPDGSKRSLADLVYTVGGDEHEFDFKITRDAVRQAWRHIGNLEAHALPWDYINFAPSYNGLPGGDFNSKRAFCPSGCYGVTGNDGAGYKDRKGHVLVDLVNDVDEWAANDLRSYQQRPVISMKAIIDALCVAANNGGYTVNLDADFFKNNNPYYSSLWLTLPKLDTIQLPGEQGSGTGIADLPEGNGVTPNISGAPTADAVVHGPWEGGASTTKYDINAQIVPRGFNTGTVRVSIGEYYTTGIYPVYQVNEYAIAVYQLVAYDAQGLAVGGSKVVMVATTGDFGLSTTNPETFVSYFNAHGGSWAPKWNDTENGIFENVIHQDGKFNSSHNYNLQDNNGDDIAYNLSIANVTGVAEVKLHVWYMGFQDSDETGMQTFMYTGADGDVTYGTFKGFSYGEPVVSYNYLSDGTAHSGSQITKKILLGGTHTPADYLLSFVKMFGLYMTYNTATKEVSILTRKNFFNGGDVNLEGKIDLPSRRSVPYAITSRWYEWASPVTGRFADYYKDVYNRDYGMARVNTGFEFDASHNEVLKDSVFNGATEVLHRNKYFVRVTQDSKAVPSPFLDGGKYSLWNDTGEAKQYDVTCPNDSAIIEYLNVNYPGYDYIMLPKPEFCDKDNKALSGEDVLLFYDASNVTTYYSRYTLTDDIGLMALYNEGAPCWLLGQWTIPANKKYTINNDAVAADRLYLPRFRRMISGLLSPMVVTHSLDMAVPSEIDQPEITVATDKAVYPRGWADYVSDKMNVDTKVLTCKVDLRGFQVGQDLLRKFYYFGGSIWVLNAIKNHVVGGDDLTECEFIKVKDKTNYTSGQTY